MSILGRHRSSGSIGELRVIEVDALVDPGSRPVVSFRYVGGHEDRYFVSVIGSPLIFPMGQYVQVQSSMTDDSVCRHMLSNCNSFSLSFL